MAQNLTGPVNLHWSDNDWNIKVSCANQDNQLGQREEHIKLLQAHFPVSAAIRDGRI